MSSPRHLEHQREIPIMVECLKLRVFEVKSVWSYECLELRVSGVMSVWSYECLEL